MLFFLLGFIVIGLGVSNLLAFNLYACLLQLFLSLVLIGVITYQPRNSRGP